MHGLSAVTSAPSSSVLPSIFVVGFPKTGTTTLHQRMVAGGAISATVKEPSVLLLDDRKAGDVSAAYQRYYPAVAAGPRVDASPHYVYDRRAVERIAALGTAQHVIVSVREPWSRLRSQYLDQFMQGFENRTLQEALAEELSAPIEVIDRSTRERNRHYLATTLYGPYVERLLDGPLGAITHLVAAETMDDPQTLACLAGYTGLALTAGDARANEARTVASGMPALVHGTAARLAGLMPAWLHQRLAPVAKPIMERMANVPLPTRRRPVLDIDAALQRDIDVHFERSAEQLRSVDRSVWAGPVPDWLAAG